MEKRISLKTNELKERLRVLTLGAGKNPLKPMTQLLFIKSFDNTVSFMTTDMINTLYTTMSCNGDLEIAVEIELFNKLIQSLKDEEISISVEKDILVIKAKGQYKIPAVYSGSGEVIKYKDRRKQFEGKLINNLFGDIYKKLRLSKADATFPVECYRNFYFGNKTMTTNTLTASVLEEQLFEGKLLFDSTVKILSAFGKNIKFEDNHFTDDTYYLITNENKNIEDYQYDDILDLFKNKKTREIEIQPLKDILDRFSLYKYENLIIENNCIKSEKEDIIEPFENDFNTTIGLDVKTLKNYVSTFKDNVNIYIDDEFILLSDGVLSHIISKKVI